MLKESHSKTKTKGRLCLLDHRSHEPSSRSSRGYLLVMRHLWRGIDLGSVHLLLASAVYLAARAGPRYRTQCLPSCLLVPLRFLLTHQNLLLNLLISRPQRLSTQVSEEKPLCLRSSLFSFFASVPSSRVRACPHPRRPRHAVANCMSYSSPFIAYFPLTDQVMFHFALDHFL